MGARDEDYLMISGIQHFAFCRRQWALIHIEQQWADNVLTVEGEILHERVHGDAEPEKRGDLLITRGLRVFSDTLRATGVCDVVEFHSDPAGATLFGRDGCFRPYPIEYKRGKPKPHDADELQLCAQAMCLEEMLLTDVPEGALFYGEPHRRTAVRFTPDLRARVSEMFAEMHRLFVRNHTPKVKPAKSCKNCALKDLCLPGLIGPSASEYILSHVKEPD